MTAYFLYTQCNILRFPGKILVPHFGVDLQHINSFRPYNPSQNVSTQNSLNAFDLITQVKTCRHRTHWTLSTL